MRILPSVSWLPKSLAALELLLGISACANEAPRTPAPISTSVIPNAKSATLPPPRIAEDPFFSSDPSLDDFDLTEPWQFRQETFLGAGEWQQHCHEFGYPELNREPIVNAMNAQLEAHGFPSKLPATVRVEHLVFAAGDFQAGLVPLDEPLVKVVACSEGLVPRRQRDQMITDWRNDPRIFELTFGEPSGAWKREYRNGTIEIGLRWSNITRERAASIFEAHGYKLDEDPKTRVPAWHLGTIAGAKLRGELWWSIVRFDLRK